MGSTIVRVISGAVQLDNERFTLKTMITKYIPRIVIILIFWHFAYYFYKYREFNIKNLITATKNLFFGKTYSHLWYLYLLLGLYIITPILSKLVQNLNKKEFIYLLVIGFGITALIPVISLLINKNLAKYIAPYKVFSVNIYVLYYLLGNFLKNIRFQSHTYY